MCASWWLGTERSATRFMPGSTDTMKPSCTGRSMSTRFMSWPGGTAYGPNQNCVFSSVPAGFCTKRWIFPFGPSSGGPCANADGASAPQASAAATNSRTDRPEDTIEPPSPGTTAGKRTRLLNVRVQSIRMGRRTKRFALAAVGDGMVWPAVAWVDKQITAEPQNRYGTAEVTTDQAEKRGCRNNDVASHDVMATETGPDGKPWFKTPVIGQGKTAFVEG